MVITIAVMKLWVDLLASATAIFANVAEPPTMRLAKNSFNPSPTLSVGDIVEADFPGYAPIIAGSGIQQSYVDPVTGKFVVQIKEPANGWHWEVTGLENLPQQVWGYYLTDSDGTDVLASARFDNPISLSGIDDGIDVPNAQFQIQQNMTA